MVYLLLSMSCTSVLGFYRVCRQMLTYGRRVPPFEMDHRISEVNAKVVRDVCSRYLYDKCPVVVGIGK
jgi:hypothetical protein